jgi:hypothetical protein
VLVVVALPPLSQTRRAAFTSTLSVSHCCCLLARCCLCSPKLIIKGEKKEKERKGKERKGKERKGKASKGKGVS